MPGQLADTGCTSQLSPPSGVWAGFQGLGGAGTQKHWGGAGFTWRTSELGYLWCRGFGTRSSRGVDPSLLKAFWCSGSGHVLSFGSGVEVGGDFWSVVSAKQLSVLLGPFELVLWLLVAPDG